MGKKITELAELSSLESNDILVAVDYSTTTTKKIQLETLRDYLGHSVDSEIDALSAAIDSLASIDYSSDINNLTNITNELSAAIDDKADSDHTHDSRYYTETEIDNLLNDYATTSITDEISAAFDYFSSLYVLNFEALGTYTYDSISELSAAIDSISTTDYSSDINNLTNITNELSAAIDDKADLLHTHDNRYYTESEINSLLNNYATTSITDTLSSAIDDNITDISNINNLNISDLSSDHTSIGTYINDIVGENVIFGETLARDPSDNKWYKSNNRTSLNFPTSTIAVENKNTDQTCKMLADGYIRDDSWSFPLTGDKIIYTGNKDGDIIYNSVELTAGYSQPIGCIFGTNIIRFLPSYSIVEISEEE